MSSPFSCKRARKYDGINQVSQRRRESHTPTHVPIPARSACERRSRRRGSPIASSARARRCCCCGDAPLLPAKNPKSAASCWACGFGQLGGGAALHMWCQPVVRAAALRSVRKCVAWNFHNKKRTLKMKAKSRALEEGVGLNGPGTVPYVYYSQSLGKNGGGVQFRR